MFKFLLDYIFQVCCCCYYQKIEEAKEDVEGNSSTQTTFQQSVATHNGEFVDVNLHSPCSAHSPTSSSSSDILPLLADAYHHGGNIS